MTDIKNPVPAGSEVGRSNGDEAASESWPLIRASELAQYGFCRRAWWLAVVKRIPSENQDKLARGRQIHTHYEQIVRAASRWRQTGFVLLGTGGFFLGVALFWLWWANDGL